MTSGLQWFVFIFGFYVVLTLLWAFRQSRRIVSSGQNARMLALLSSGYENRFGLLFLMGSGAFILIPSIVFLYGLWGIIWIGFALLTLWFQGWLFGFRADKGASFLRRLFQNPLVQSLKTLFLVAGVVMLLAWQFLAMTHIISALGFVPRVQTISLLALALFLLVSVSLAGKNIFLHLSRIKLFLFVVLFAAIIFIIFVYIGGFPKIGQHLSQFYQISFATNSVDEIISKSLYVQREQGVLLREHGVVAFGFSLIVIMMFYEMKADVFASKQSPKNVEPKRGLSSVFQFMIALFVFSLFIIYVLFLGLGAHFVGADLSYSQSYGDRVSTLFEPILVSGFYPNLMVNLLKSLVPIIPVVIAVATALVLVILLTTSQMLLFQAGKMINANLVEPVLSVVGADSARDEISGDVRQRRSYAVILMAVMFVSQL